MPIMTTCMYHRKFLINFGSCNSSKMIMRLAVHLFTDGQLDGRGVFIEALQQVSRFDVLVEESRLLPQHCLQVLLPQPGGLPGACKMKDSGVISRFQYLLRTDMLRRGAMAHDRHQKAGSGQSSDCRDWCSRILVASTCIATTF